MSNSKFYNTAKSFNVSEKIMHKLKFIDFVHTKIMQYGSDNIPLFAINPDEKFVKDMKINSDILCSTFKPNKSQQVTIESLRNNSGVYYMVSTKKYTSTSVLKIKKHAENMSDSKSSINLRQLLCRKSLKQLKEMSYEQDIVYSYMKEAYKKNKELPPGWNLNNLDNFLKDILEKDFIEGASESMFYKGEISTFSSFHAEDLYFASVSFLYPGSAPKVWVAVHPKYRHIIETHIKKQQGKTGGCNYPLNHKYFLIDIELLEELEIPYIVHVQKPGTFVVTLPGVFHIVANAGKNLAEAVNFIPFRWHEISRRQEFLCCSGSRKIYKEQPWPRIIKAIKNAEVEMAIEANKFCQKYVSDEKDGIDAETISSEMDTDLSNKDEKCSQPSSPLVIEMQFEINNEDTSIKLVSDNGSCNAPVQQKCADNSMTDLDFHDHAFNLVEYLNDEDEDMPYIPNSDNTNDKRNINEISLSPPFIQGMVEDANDVTASSRFNVESTVSTTEVLSLETAEKLINDFERRQKKNKSNLEPRRNYRERKKAAGIASSKPKPKRTLAAKVFQTKVQKAKRKINRYSQLVEKHNSNIKNASAEMYSKYIETLESAKESMKQIVRRRELAQACIKIFKQKNVDRRLQEGYVTYEIVRDFLDGRQQCYRECIISAMKLVKCENMPFWKDAVQDEASWNSTFGVDEHFRVPAQNYNQTFY